MTTAASATVDRIARTLLYEGYVLYPYRRSSVKNRRRFTFGGVFPRAFAATSETGDVWWCQTECLVEGGPEAHLAVTARFLHLSRRVDDAGPDPWQEAIEREVRREASLGELVTGRSFEFAFPGSRDASRASEPVAGTIEVAATRLEADLWRVSARISNVTPLATGLSREEAQGSAFASTHTVFHVERGAFVSLLEPPPGREAAAAGCKNVSTWPVLVGGDRDTVLSSPIILYDQPRLADESPGDLFDATEIDEILTLRILTLTDQEKREVRATDPRAAALLDRTEALTADELMALHGRLDKASLPTEARHPSGVVMVAGDRVRLRPRKGGDVFDVALAGRTARVVSVETDLEGRTFLSVTVDDDPGSDLGEAGLPAHRFYFRPEEVDPL